jgi:hypothetical protein
VGVAAIRGAVPGAPQPTSPRVRTAVASVLTCAAPESGSNRVVKSSAFPATGWDGWTGPAPPAVIMSLACESLVTAAMSPPTIWEQDVVGSNPATPTTLGHDSVRESCPSGRASTEPGSAVWTKGGPRLPAASAWVAGLSVDPRESRPIWLFKYPGARCMYPGAHGREYRHHPRSRRANRRCPRCRARGDLRCRVESDGVSRAVAASLPQRWQRTDLSPGSPPTRQRLLQRRRDPIGPDRPVTRPPSVSDLRRGRARLLPDAVIPEVDAPSAQLMTTSSPGIDILLP